MDAAENKLRDGLAAMAPAVDESQIRALLQYVALIAKWNQTYNLTAVRDPLDMMGLHILDSLTLLPHILPPTVADIGTGAGLPGIPLAICLPACRFTLIDANAKKTRFVQQAVLELKLQNVEVRQARVENLPADRLYTTVVARAFTAMPELVRLTSRLMAAGGRLLAMKGQQPAAELAELTCPYSVIPLNVPGITAERCLIQVEKPDHG